MSDDISVAESGVERLKEEVGFAGGLDCWISFFGSKPSKILI